MILSPIIRNDRLRHSSIRCMESGYCQKSGAPQISFCNALEENSQVKTFKISTNSKPIFIPGGRISDHFHITGIVNGSIPIIDFAIAIQVFKFHVTWSKEKVGAILHPWLVYWIISFQFISLSPAGSVPLRHFFRKIDQLRISICIQFKVIVLIQPIRLISPRSEEHRVENAE